MKISVLYLYLYLFFDFELFSLDTFLGEESPGEMYNPCRMWPNSFSKE